MSAVASHGATVQVGERTLALSNLNKILYPQAGFSKGQVIDYYARIAPIVLPHLRGRCITFRRFPNGSDQAGFFEKRCPSHRPEWVGTALGPGDRDGNIGYCRLDEPASLVWSANLAALELHVPMAAAVDLETPLAMVFDFDPGEPAAMRDCCEVALWTRDILAAVGLEGFPKTSGSKGLQLYVPLNTPCTHQHAADVALAIGQLLERQHSERVTTTMAKAVRPGKIFVDWSQNSRHKTTIGVYSLRARPHPTVSTPVLWSEVESCASGGPDLRFLAADVLRRVDEHGDLFGQVLTLQQTLPGGT